MEKIQAFITFVATVVAVGLLALGAGDSCGERSLVSLLLPAKECSGRSKNMQRRDGNGSDKPNVPMSTSLLHETLFNRTDGV